MYYYSRIIFAVFSLVFLAGCQQKTYPLADLIEETSSEFDRLQLAPETAVMDMGMLLKETDLANINEFVELTNKSSVKEIGKQDAKEIYDELYQEKNNGGKKILSANIAVGENLSHSFYIYLVEDGRVLATRFENGQGEQHYINATNSTDLFEAAADYYEDNFIENEKVQVLDLLEEE